jgi:hypothetical protein
MTICPIRQIKLTQGLYFVLMGGNDIRGLRSQTSREMAEARINEMILAYMLWLGRLSSAGTQ